MATQENKQQQGKTTERKDAPSTEKSTERKSRSSVEEARKADLRAKAEQLGVDTSGSEAEVRARVLEADTVQGGANNDPTDPNTHKSKVVEAGRSAEPLKAQAKAALKAAKEVGSDEDGLNPTRLTSTRGQESAEKNPLGLATSRETGYIGVDPIYQNFSDDRRKPLDAEEGPEAEAEERAYANAEVLEAQSVGVGRLGFRNSRPNLEQEA